MKASSKSPEDKSARERNARAPATLEQQATRSSSVAPASRSKCPGLEDPLGNFSEQTGAFFG